MVISNDSYSQNKFNTIEKEKGVEEALIYLYRFIEIPLNTGRFEEVNDIYRNLNIYECSSKCLSAFISIMTRWKDSFEKDVTDSFFNKVYNKLSESHTQKEVEKIMGIKH